MERSIQKSGLVNLATALLVAVAGFVVARYSNSLAGQVGSLFLGLSVLVTAVSWFQMRLEDRERLERLELDELSKSHTGSALFEAKDAEVFPAQRSREQFERFFVPSFTVLLFLLQAGGSYVFWRWLSQTTISIELKQPVTALALFALFGLVLFMLGRFSVTIARLGNYRLLRPGASYLLFNAFLCWFVTLGIFGVWAGMPKGDWYAAHVLCVLLALVAIETLTQLVLEIYRPRVKGRVGRPLYESRVVGLLGQPEGLITTAAEALDYQFGFKVSETWFYQLFFERALKWVLLGQIAVLFFSTSVVFIQAGEQGLLERFGKPVAGRTVLNPGAHFKWPWPIDRVYRYRTEQIQSFDIGFVPDPNLEKETIVLWSVAHTKEDNFLVANREPAAVEAAAAQTNGVPSKRTPPVSLITGSIPVQFQITNLTSWVYTNEDAPSLLTDLATREVMRYFVGADMSDLMSWGRGQASRILVERIQAAADEHQLGAQVISVSLQDLHPPVKVAQDYEKVIGALQTKQAKILAAKADEIKTNALTSARVASILNRANSDATAREISAVAQAALFTNQIPAFHSAPAVYVERAYLNTFARATADARKYVLLTTNTHDVLTFDLQDKFRADLLQDISVPSPKK